MFIKFEKEIKKSLKILKEGKILLYPTDTVWGLGCDLFNSEAIKKLYRIKKRDHSKSMIILVDNIDRLQKIVGKISDFNKKIILNNFKSKKKPITIIYHLNDKKNKITDSIFFLKKKTLAIRLTYDLFCSYLIYKFNRPIISTSANLSGSKSPISFIDIDFSILSQIDYAVNLKRNRKSVFNESKIIQIFSKKIKILRV